MIKKGIKTLGLLSTKNYPNQLETKSLHHYKLNLKSLAAILAFFVPISLISQNEINKRQVFEDYTLFKEVLLQAHPSLYEYNTKSQWDSLFQDFEERDLPSVVNIQVLYISLIEMADFARDGHLLVMRPQLQTLPRLFPLLLKIIDGNFYTDTEDFNIPVGSQVLAIDKIQAEDLRTRMMKYAPSDGFNSSKKDRQIEREFGILHYYEFGEKDSYQVQFKSPEGELKTTIIESQSFESIGQRFANRFSYFNSSALKEKEPHLYFIDSLNTAVLSLNAFGIQQDRFQSKAKQLFKEIRKKKVEHLIIDIRQNEGGFPENANFIFSYIAKESFIQPISQEIRISELPNKAFSKEVLQGSNFDSFFKNHFSHSPMEDGRWAIHAPKEESLMTPIRKGFKGKTHVLIGGKTFSAAATFALNCKNQGIALYGEETGGGAHFHTGGYPVVYELPNSKIKFMIFLVKVNKKVRDGSLKKGMGVLPDFQIDLSVQDLMLKKDSQLHYILDQINSHSN